MISRIGIKGLKCFDDKDFIMKPFTLLTGMNSAGKSTLIQALLLTIQNVTDKGVSALNGYLAALGDFSEARNFITNARTINIYIENNNERTAIEIYFSEDEGVAKCLVKSSDNFNSTLNYNNGGIHYISSDRIGIQDLYEKNYSSFKDFGVRGEYAFDFYEKYKSSTLPDYLIKDKTISETLEGNLDYWLRYVLDCHLKTEEIKGTDKIKVSYQYGDRSRAVRPKNIGTGLSYVMSLMIVGLSSYKGDLLVIENPEIHLHPRAQSKLTEFLAFLADKGIQFIIETHSDHIFNGIRKAVKKNVISEDNVSIYYFKMDEEKLLSDPVKVILNKHGIIENHQKGLFDQFDDDLDELLGI